jgi:methylase of polypeptide subunit release factors
MLAVEGERAVPLVKVQSYHGLLLVSDMPGRVRAGAASDHVMGVANSSLLLAQATVRRPARQALDLGTGCGVFALLAAPHSERVWATDKNPRAAMLARFNARLNGIANVECAAGDLFEPVAGRRFDLIVASPPFVIGPRARYLFCDSGVRGDEFCRRLIRLVPSFLEEGGFCHLLCNWTHRAGADWREGLAGWFDGTGCDVLVLGGETEDASSYAMTWIKDTEPGGPERFAEHYDRWMNYLEGEGIEAVSYGVIALRRAGGRPNWVSLEETPEKLAGPCGDRVLARFEAQDYLESLPDERQLLDARFRVAPGLRLEQEYEVTPDGLAAAGARLRLPAGLVRTTEIDSRVLALVVRCDGKRPLRDAFAEIAAALSVAQDQIVPGGLALVRQMLQKGYVVPA